MKKNKIRNVALVIFTMGMALILVGCDLLSPPEKNDGNSSEVALTYLGKGYDIFSVYADSTTIYDSILDFDALNNAGMLERTKEEHSDAYKASGTSVSEYLSSYQVDLSLSADYKVFSGTLSSKFGSASFTSRTTAYATYASPVRKYKEKVLNQYNNADILRSYVISDVMDLLDGCSSKDEARDFFASYGTHVILWDYLGARIDYHATTESTDTSFSNNFSASVAAQYRGLSTDDQYSQSDESKEFNSSAKTELQIYGGPSQYANSILSGDYSAWEEGVGDPSTWTLCDFELNGSKSSLMPVWALCSGDDDGVDEVAFFKAAFDDWADGKEVVIEEVQPKSYTVTFSLDYVWVKLNNEPGHEGEFYGKLSIDGSTLWNVSNGTSDWEFKDNGKGAQTDTSGFVDSSSRYHSVSKTFEPDEKIILKVNSLKEDDSKLDDTFSTPGKTYKISDIKGWDGGHLYIKSTDGGDFVKFYVLVNVVKNY